jgi:hypothetical protein
MIKEKHNVPGIEIDTTVYNPSRIARVPGTLNISDEKNKVQSMLMNNPDGLEDEKLTEQILSLEIPIQHHASAIIGTGIPGLGLANVNMFMDYCMTHQIPEGERNKTINKNLAIYFHHVEEFFVLVLLNHNGDNHLFQKVIESKNFEY